MLAALDAIWNHLNELTRLSDELVTWCYYDNTGVWQQPGAQRGWATELKVMKEHITQAHERVTDGGSVVESLGDAPAGLRGSAEIYRLGSKHVLRCANRRRHNILNDGRYLNQWLWDRITKGVELAVSINKLTSCLLDCIDALRTALPLRDLSRVSRTYKELIEENERTIEGLVIEDLERGVFHALQAVLVVGLEPQKQTPAHEADKDEGEPQPAVEKTNEGCSLVSEPVTAHSNNK